MKRGILWKNYIIFRKNVEIRLLLAQRSKLKLHDKNNFIAPKSPKSVVLRMMPTPIPSFPVIFPQNPHPAPYRHATLSKALATEPYWQIHPCQ